MNWLAVIFIVISFISGMAIGWHFPQSRGQIIEPMSKESQLCDQYRDYIFIVSRKVYKGQYRLANHYADMALRLRASIAAPLNEELRTSKQYDILSSDDNFSVSLNALGRYKEAEALILSLPPVDQMYKFLHNGPMIGYRRSNLCQAYLGLNRFRDASCELEIPIPSLVQENRTYLDLDLSLAMAYLAQRNEASASRVLTRLKHRAYYDRYNTKLCELLIQIPKANNSEANKIAGSLIVSLLSFPEDPSIAPYFDSVSAIMEAYGHSDAAIMLSVIANTIRQK